MSTLVIGWSQGVGIAEIFPEILMTISDSFLWISFIGSKCIICIYIYTYILGMHQCYESAKACSKKIPYKTPRKPGRCLCPNEQTSKIVIGFSLDDKQDISKVEFLFDRVVAASTVRTSVDVPCRNNVLRAWGLNSEILILIKETGLGGQKGGCLADQSDIP